MVEEHLPNSGIVKSFIYRHMPTIVQDWMQDKQTIKSLEQGYKADETNQISKGDSSFKQYENDMESGVGHIKAWKDHQVRMGVEPDIDYDEYVAETRHEEKSAEQSRQVNLGENYMADLANGQRNNDLVDRMTSMESGRLPGTTPTLEPRSSLEAAWNPKTGTFQSAAVQFALEEPNTIAHEEFAQDHQTERADGKIETPEQNAFEFGGREDEPDYEALCNKMFEKEPDFRKWTGIEIDEYNDMIKADNEALERQWNYPGSDTRGDEDMER